jgi:hypothetical protein
VVRKFNRGIWAGILFLGFALAAQAQEVAQTGIVTSATNATVGVAPVSNGTTIFSGDLIKTGDAGRLQVQSGSMQFVFDANTSARIFRSGERTVIELERGSMSYSAKGVSENLVLFAQDIKFVPKTTELAVGQISIVSRCEVRATPLRSTMEATSGKETRTIETNRSYQALSEVGVDYNDSWKPIQPEYPEYPRDAEYHHSHNHVACAPGVWKAQKLPVSAGSPGHFNLVVGGTAAVVTAILVKKALQSPDQP